MSETPILTDEQNAAITKIVTWMDNFGLPGFTQPVMRMVGPAGSGKTTLMRTVAERTKRLVRFGAFAGKAAMVLDVKGCVGAETIHKMIYEPRGTSVKKYRQELEKLQGLTNPSDIVVQEALVEKLRVAMASPGFTRRLASDFDRDTAFGLDEVSQVDKFVGFDIESYGFPILAVGDPFQLPPIQGSGWFFPKGFTPDIELKAVHRQAADSPVLKIATNIRVGRAVPYGTWGDSSVVPKIPLKTYMDHDQILCGTNKNRVTINNKVRTALGRKKWLEPTDKLVCLQNNYELGVMNGSQWEVIEVSLRKTKKGKPIYYATLKSLDFKDSEYVTAPIFLPPLQEGTSQYDKYWTPMLENLPEGLVMTYGYCMTVHKAQGSQWDSVALYDDWPGNYQSEWRYTGVTRAAKTITWVRP